MSSVLTLNTQTTNKDLPRLHKLQRNGLVAAHYLGRNDELSRRDASGAGKTLTKDGVAAFPSDYSAHVNGQNGYVTQVPESANMTLLVIARPRQDLDNQSAFPLGNWDDDQDGGAAKFGSTLWWQESSSSDNIKLSCTCITHRTGSPATYVNIPLTHTIDGYAANRAKYWCWAMTIDSDAEFLKLFAPGIQSDPVNSVDMATLTATTSLSNRFLKHPITELPLYHKIGVSNDSSFQSLSSTNMEVLKVQLHNQVLTPAQLQQQFLDDKQFYADAYGIVIN